MSPQGGEPTVRDMNRPLRLMGRILLACAIAGTALTTRTASAAPARPAPADRILFMGTRNGNADLYVTSATQRVRPVVSNPGHDCGPALAPGPGPRRLVFASMRLNPDGSYDPGGHFQLYNLDFRTRKVTRLTDGLDQHSLGPTWSPDGKHIAFASTRNGSVGTPNWPIANSAIWIMDADGSHLRQVTDNGETHSHSFPSWSPDGKWIAFMSTSKADATRPSINVVRPNGEGMHVLQYDGLYPSWSPDSKHLAFNSARSGLAMDQDVYVMNADGSDARRLTSLPGAEYMPSWSPDGRRLTYVHDPDGWTDIASVVLLPTGHTRDVYSSGPIHSSIWVAELSIAKGVFKVTARHQTTTGGDDLFPKFAPAWLR
jgi:Tol biopolymer transport system component